MVAIFYREIEPGIKYRTVLLNLGTTVDYTIFRSNLETASNPESLFSSGIRALCCPATLLQNLAQLRLRLNPSSKFRVPFPACVKPFKPATGSPVGSVSPAKHRRSSAMVPWRHDCACMASLRIRKPAMRLLASRSSCNSSAVGAWTSSGSMLANFHHRQSQRGSHHFGGLILNSFSALVWKNFRFTSSGMSIASMAITSSTGH